MTQRQLDRAVARATGESLATIAHRGFSVVDPVAARDDCELAVFGPNHIDWDERDKQRIGYLPQRMAVAWRVP
jgi:hypothetical protein